MTPTDRRECMALLRWTQRGFAAVTPWFGVLPARKPVPSALRTAKIGTSVDTALHLLRVADLPDDIRASLTGKQLGAIMDGPWRVAQNSKAIAAREAIAEGAIWDHNRQALREIAA